MRAEIVVYMSRKNMKNRGWRDLSKSPHVIWRDLSKHDFHVFSPIYTTIECLPTHIILIVIHNVYCTTDYHFIRITHIVRIDFYYRPGLNCIANGSAYTFIVCDAVLYVTCIVR